MARPHLRALFLATYPATAAATRFRFTQFFPYLEGNGIECTLSSFLSEREFSQLYLPRDRARKAIRLLAGGVRRVLEAFRARAFDVAVVQRSAMLYGPPLMEWLIARVLRVPLVYDFDDAIWIQEPSPVWGRWATWAKFGGKTEQLIRMASEVVVCNGYTRDYALRATDPARVTVIPTVVDPLVFTPRPHDAEAPPVVGWIGTHSTAKYLWSLAGPLAAANRRAPFRMKVVGAGAPFAVDGVQVENKPWRLDEEVADYQSLDVGLYPVTDDAWGHGKTGFKPILYMSSGAACISSPVGGVTEFVRDGENGLFARDAAQWEERIVPLVTDRRLRERIAAAARRTVVEAYSLQVQAPRLAAVLRRAVS